MTKRQQNDVADLMKLEHGLVEWQVDFLDKIFTEFWEEDKVLTDEQAETLQVIVDRLL